MSTIIMLPEGRILQEGGGDFFGASISGFIISMVTLAFLFVGCVFCTPKCFEKNAEVEVAAEGDP